ncbi:MAG TPA: hypothetical protein VIW70_05575 [Rubrivivax sp.]
MKIRFLPMLTSAAIACAILPALSQTAASGPSTARAPAAVPQASAPGARVQTPTEAREAATIPGDLRPEEKITPQIVIPLRTSAALTPGASTDARQGAAASGAAIDDAAARCQAQASKAAREKCSAATAQKGPPAPSR